MLIIGIGGAVLSFGSFNFSGMALAAVFGIILNLILPNEESESESSSLE